MIFATNLEGRIKHKFFFRTKKLYVRKFYKGINHNAFEKTFLYHFFNQFEASNDPTLFFRAFQINVNYMESPK